MKLKITLALNTCLFLLCSSCSVTETKNPPKNSPSNTNDAPAKHLPIQIAPAGASVAFPNAKLALLGVKAVKKGNDSAQVAFNFIVSGFDLKSQTTDANSKTCANSDKGQHIHFILDGNPYAALYEPKHEITVPLNSDHYMMAFFGRSYHESIKQKGASLLFHFKIDAKGNLTKLGDPKNAMVFYSRPKGDYIGKDATKILLDYYLLNTPSDAGFKVKAAIQNITTHDSASFILDKWEPQIIENLGYGKCLIQLSILDKEGHTVEGTNSHASRTFNTAESEPLK